MARSAMTELSASIREKTTSAAFDRDGLRNVVAVGAILLLAAGLRYWGLNDLPPGLWYDEAHHSVVAMEIAFEGKRPIYVETDNGIEAGFMYLLAAYHRAFGVSVHGARVLSALVGVLTIPLLLVTLRLVPIDGRPGLTSLLAAATLGGMYWHVHWSRLGLETILVPLFAVAILAGLAWAWKRPALGRFFLAGTALGLSQYTNPGARILPLEAVAAFLILAEWGHSVSSKPVFPGSPPGRGNWLSVLGRIALFGSAYSIGAFIAYAPLGSYFLQNPEWFFNRAGYVSQGAREGGWDVILSNALKTLGSINLAGDVMVRHNLPSRPALDPLMSMWSLLGLAAMARSGRRQAWAWFAAIVVNLLPMVFSDGAPGFGRTLGAAPLLAAVPAAGMSATLGWAESHVRRTRRITWTVVAASIVLSTAWTTNDYFHVWASRSDLFDAFEVGRYELAQAAAKASGHGPAYLALDEASLHHPTTRLIQAVSPGEVRTFNAEHCAVHLADDPRPVRYGVLAQAFPVLMERYSGWYPAAVVNDILHSPEPYRYAAYFDVPANTRSTDAELVPLASYAGAFELLAIEADNEEEWTAGSTQRLNLKWHALESVDPRYTVFLHLVSEKTPFAGGRDSEPCGGWYPTSVWRSGEIVDDRMALDLPVELPAGEYWLAVGWYDAGTGARLPAVSSTNEVSDDRVMALPVTVRAP